MPGEFTPEEISRIRSLIAWWSSLSFWRRILLCRKLF